jgi:hypothetical protein
MDNIKSFLLKNKTITIFFIVLICITLIFKLGFNNSNNKNNNSFKLKRRNAMTEKEIDLILKRINAFNKNLRNNLKEEN